MPHMPRPAARRRGKDAGARRHPDSRKPPRRSQAGAHEPRRAEDQQVPDREPATGQPGIWFALDFEVGDARAEDPAHTFARALDRPGWYMNFQSPAESFIADPEEIFRYPRGDQAGRAEAQAHGHQLGIPGPHLDRTTSDEQPPS